MLINSNAPSLCNVVMTVKFSLACIMLWGPFNNPWHFPTSLGCADAAR